MLLGTAGSCWNAGGQWMNRLNRKSSDMLREEERKRGGGMGGQRNFMCNATAERSLRTKLVEVMEFQWSSFKS